MNTSSTRTGGRSSGTSTVTGWPLDATSVRAKASRDEVGQREHREVRPELPGLDPAHVEEVGDQSVQPFGLAVDGTGDLPALVGRPLDVGVHEHARGRPDGRERRPQVVGDGVEQRRLDRLAAPRDLGGRRLAAEPVALERPTDLVGGGGDDARLAVVRIAQPSGPDDPDGAERAVAGGDGDADRRSRRRDCVAFCACGRGVDPDPFGRLVAGASTERGVHRRDSSALGAAGRCGVGHDRLAHHDPDAGRLDLVAHHPGDRRPGPTPDPVRWRG